MNISVNMNLSNLVIGVVSYEGVKITLGGPYLANVIAVNYAGYDSRNIHCGSAIATSISGAPAAAEKTILISPNAPFSVNGRLTIICAYSCSNTTTAGECNTFLQVEAYFQSVYPNAVTYKHQLQYGCWAGTQVVSGNSTCGSPAPAPNPTTANGSSSQSAVPVAAGAAVGAIVVIVMIMYFVYNRGKKVDRAQLVPFEFELSGMTPAMIDNPIHHTYDGTREDSFLHESYASSESSSDMHLADFRVMNPMYEIRPNPLDLTDMARQQHDKLNGYAELPLTVHYKQSGYCSLSVAAMELQQDGKLDGYAEVSLTVPAMAHQQRDEESGYAEESLSSLQQHDEVNGYYSDMSGETDFGHRKQLELNTSHDEMSLVLPVIPPDATLIDPVYFEGIDALYADNFGSLIAVVPLTEKLTVPLNHYYEDPDAGYGSFR